MFPAVGDLTPQRDQPGTLVTVDGAGFCPNAVVQFGNKDAVATPVSVNPSGTEITVRTPQLATDGPLTVENILAGSTTPSSSATSAQTVTINSYRNVNGYQFHNYVPHIDFAQMTQAFGEGQTYIAVNLCIFGCTVHIRNPLAMALNAIANAAIGRSGGGGACFGFALSTQRILMGQKAVSDFPNDSNGAIFGLDTPNGPWARSPTTSTRWPSPSSAGRSCTTGCPRWPATSPTAGPPRRRTSTTRSTPSSRKVATP